ncbi:hypothetical protein N7510_003204 [Penicillium lagena]|uniref:uncharacterized protein n=1 Tax=Penicillium lagena TaxID=94218 RepID=UPI00253FEE1B|nr:uncharacterized protein N7510_003204 [Penicillium lagena]KAJ5619220.1 hypothetical protein N7510_003204 [Penicillium lagena]
MSIIIMGDFSHQSSYTKNGTELRADHESNALGAHEHQRKTNQRNTLNDVEAALFGPDLRPPRARPSPIQGGPGAGSAPIREMV